MNNFLGKEIYSVADINKEYVNFIVLIYDHEQFYFLFNERKLNDGLDFEKNNDQLAQNLKELIAKASKFLNFDFEEISFNIKSDEIKIKKSFYIHEFEGLVNFDKHRLEEVNHGFFANEKEIDGYKNFLGKIIKFYSIEQKKNLQAPVFGEKIRALRVDGLIYQLPWKDIISYDFFLKKAGAKKIKPVFFPYSALIGVLFSKKNEKTSIIIWNENKCMIYYFSQNIFLMQIEIKKPISMLIDKIAKEYGYSYEDIKNFIFIFLDLKEEKNKLLKICLESTNPRLNEIRNKIQTMTLNYISQVTDEIIFKAKEMFKEDPKNIEFNIVGDIQKLTNLNIFFKNKKDGIDWKVNSTQFIGIKDYNDLFAIGNAYFQHLEKKLMYN